MVLSDSNEKSSTKHVMKASTREISEGQGSRALSTVKDFFRSAHIQIALASGISIITLSYFSKYVLSTPLSKISMAIPAFVIPIYEYIAHRNEGKRIATPFYWCLAILTATAIVIAFHLVRY